MSYILKAARDWFKNNPNCKVIYHRRWNELSPASKERLTMTRTVRVVGRTAKFSDHSELSLMTDSNTSSVSNELLDIFDGDGQIIVTYANSDKARAILEA